MQPLWTPSYAVPTTLFLQDGFDPLWCYYPYFTGDTLTDRAQEDLFVDFTTSDDQYGDATFYTEDSSSGDVAPDPDNIGVLRTDIDFDPRWPDDVADANCEKFLYIDDETGAGTDLGTGMRRYLDIGKLKNIDDVDDLCRHLVYYNSGSIAS